MPAVITTDQEWSFHIVGTVIIIINVFFLEKTEEVLPMSFQ